MPRTVLTEEQKDSIRQMHAEGKSRNAIAQTLGITVHSLFLYANEIGLDFSKRTAPLSQTDQDQIRALHEQGFTRTEIAARIHCRPETVTKWAATQGLTFPSEANRQRQDARELAVRTRVTRAHERHLRILEHEQNRLLDHYENHTPWPTKMRGKYGEERIEQLPLILSDDWRNVSAALAATANTLRVLTTTENPTDQAARSMADRLAEALGLPKNEGRAITYEALPEEPPKRHRPGGHKKDRDY